ncbi:uncharacterized protein CIMG_01207 [Coccidioides immitis RS]|uniref:Aminotransferase class I/classII large domain-containing protein n=1 Tax=Coccidioides immitis (strain RS) TaxID=246410 RepID=A0A0E1S085_COCIM|nr:uncharacterized protein CIMG_01207 [Coccidioides immitis RS]EAS35853.2 hypothetical protein CIMG_01207 [Coccidioides immitis RS]TPX25947.1 hypothetical protein DIZ76_011405 [Coccidioides immitis]
MLGISKFRRRFPRGGIQFVRKSGASFVEEHSVMPIEDADEAKLAVSDSKAGSLENDPQKVNFTRPVEPPVALVEKFLFLIWSIMLVLTQVWSDFIEKRPFRYVLKSDIMAHYFFLPAGRHDPRFVTSGPYSRINVKMIPPNVTRRYEEDTDLSTFEEVEIINCASNNYGGFTELENRSGEIIETALQLLPFAPAPNALELRVRAKCAEYMSCDACVTAPSGFSTNRLIFATVAGVARSQGRKLVFLCDRDSHNSMFTGAFFNKEAEVHKFDHNDLTDLEYKLRMQREQDPSALVCVAVEGIYSMEGSVSPGPALLALKKVYNFALLVDEAHSFMALGSAGRGSFNHWEDLGYKCPLEEVDVMSCMFSKSVGCTGGFALANGVFAEELRKQGETLKERGVETLSTVVLLRILNLLSKPKLIRHRMCLLRKKSEYISRALGNAGFRILSTPGSPIVCFPVGTVRQVIRFHAEALKEGVAVTGGVPPATPLWCCRIRVCIFATTSWPDIYKLLGTMLRIGQKVGVNGISPISFDAGLLAQQDPEDSMLEVESNSVDSDMLDYVIELSGSTKGLAGNTEVVRTGMESIRKYGIGPCSARWFYGSFDIFIQLERRLANLYPSLVAQSGKCRGMICGDAEITLGSTVAALVQPCSSGSTLNRVFIPNNAPHSVMAGARLNRPSKQVAATFYNAVEDIELPTGHKNVHATLYFETVRNGIPLDLHTFIRKIAPKVKRSGNLTGATIMFDDRNGLGMVGPQSLGYLNLMEAKHGVNFLNDALRPLQCEVEVIVAGSWFDAFGHQGGYVTGSASKVECLTWNTKAFFFSTPPMPVQAAMSDRMLQVLLNKDSKKKAVAWES